MDKNNSPGHGGGLPPPPSGRFSGYSHTSATTPFTLKPESSTSSSYPSLVPATTTSDSATFSHDMSNMLDKPPRSRGHHRRAHSEILTILEDIVSFDSDLGVVGVGAADGPSFSDDTEEDLLSMYLDMDKFNSSSSSATSTFQIGEPAPRGSVPVSEAPARSSDNIVDNTNNERPRFRHQHSQSMDGSSSTIKTDMLVSDGSEDNAAADPKKAMSAAKLAELTLMDPKRAKRIWANRQSAARSKERKMRYISELERKLQTLQTEATSLSAQLTLLQRDTNGMTAENSELKLRLQTVEQQVHLQDALNDALKEEIQHLKVLTGQAMPSGGGGSMNYASFGGGGQQQFYPNNQSLHTLLAAQQLQIHSQKQRQHQLQQQQQQFKKHQLQQQQQFQQQPLQPQQQQPEQKDTCQYA